MLKHCPPFGASAGGSAGGGGGGLIWNLWSLATNFWNKCGRLYFWYLCDSCRLPCWRVGVKANGAKSGARGRFTIQGSKRKATGAMRQVLAELRKFTISRLRLTHGAVNYPAPSCLRARRTPTTGVKMGLLTALEPNPIRDSGHLGLHLKERQ